MRAALEALYPKVMGNHAVQTLDSWLFRRLIEFWCISSQHDGFLPGTSELAWLLRGHENAVSKDIGELTERGLLEIVDGRVRPVGLEPAVEPKPAKRFVKPTPEQVTDYAKTIGFVLDGRAFCDFYESRGWQIGKVAMKDWKAAVRTWKARRQEEAQQPAPGPRRGPVDLKGE